MSGLEINPLLGSEYINISLRIPRALVQAIDEYAGDTPRAQIITGTLLTAFPEALPAGWVYRGRARACAWRGQTQGKVLP